MVLFDLNMHFFDKQSVNLAKIMDKNLKIMGGRVTK